MKKALFTLGLIVGLSLTTPQDVKAQEQNVIQDTTISAVPYSSSVMLSGDGYNETAVLSAFAVNRNLGWIEVRRVEKGLYNNDFLNYVRADALIDAEINDGDVQSINFTGNYHMDTKVLEVKSIQGNGAHKVDFTRP